MASWKKHKSAIFIYQFWTHRSTAKLLVCRGVHGLTKPPHPFQLGPFGAENSVLVYNVHVSVPYQNYFCLGPASPLFCIRPQCGSNIGALISNQLLIGVLGAGLEWSRTIRWAIGQIFLSNVLQKKFLWNKKNLILYRSQLFMQYKMLTWIWFKIFILYFEYLGWFGYYILERTFVRNQFWTSS